MDKHNPTMPDRTSTGMAYSNGSVTNWLMQCREGNSIAAGKLVERYLEKLRRVAEKQTRGNYQDFADAEDLAISSLHAMLQVLIQQNYPGLNDRDQLWGLLRTILRRRIANQVRARRAQRRGGDAVRTHRDPNCFSAGQSPEAELEARDELQKLISLLPNERLQLTVVLRLDGLTHDQIADRMDISVPTVERYIRQIREAWKAELSAS